MAAKPKSLQGSLFGDAKTNDFEIRNSKTNAEDTNQELSEEELTHDAQLRPRKRKTRQSNEAIVPSNNAKTESDPDSDLPAWSHHSLVDKEQLTPALRHYVELKIANPERILLYRLGDFFECFFDDAIKLSDLLELTLTGKEGGKAIGRVPMAGIPHHAAERYCSELIRKGLSVAICDQVESSANKGSLLKREITRVLTPGTVIEEGMLQARRNNWLAAVVLEKQSDKQKIYWGLASADVSTGEFLLMQGKGNDSLYQELNKLDPSEVIWGKSEDNRSQAWCPERLHLTQIPLTPFNRPEAELALKNHFKLKTIQVLGLQDCSLSMRSAGGLLNYLNNTNPITQNANNFSNSNRIPLDLPQLIFQEDSLIIDAQTRRNLEITSTQRDGQFKGSLLWAIDRTLTSMGGRCLRRWLDKPLINVKAIQERQDIVSELVSSHNLRKSIRKSLRAMSDLERLAGRAGAGQAGARDLVAIADTLNRLPRLSASLKELKSKGPEWLTSLKNVDTDLIGLADLIHNQIIENPPLSITEGGLIYDGVDKLLDGIRNRL
ncbi:MAG: DNA mismatch repair protein MutS, partial [Prochlorococcaceae cyanobacterium ETNP1_MAG_9]|nr:DNA mismatch repair protein MutS [Prochlorococcaceae cyanobacterium ETNP1_MAG_9]